MEIQTIIEKILRKHNVDVSKDFYLKLRMPPYLDLSMERNGDIVMVGHYIEQNDDLISDPVLVFDYNNGEWLAYGIEQVLGDTACAYFDNGKRVVYEDRIKEFKTFQKMFAKNIQEQGWEKNGVKVQTGLICQVMIVGKDEQNP